MVSNALIYSVLCNQESMDSSQQVSTISIAVAIVINWLYGLGLKRQENNNTGGRGAGHATI